METEDGTLYLDMKCGNLMQQRISRIQTDQAIEIARLIKQYITIGQYSILQSVRFRILKAGS
jgi:myosin-15